VAETDGEGVAPGSFVSTVGLGAGAPVGAPDALGGAPSARGSLLLAQAPRRSVEITKETAARWPATKCIVVFYAWTSNRLRIFLPCGHFVVPGATIAAFERILGVMRCAAVVVLGIFSVACSAATPAGDGADAGAADVTTTDAPTEPVECAKPPGEWEEGKDPPAYCVREVVGALTDTEGNSLAGIGVSLCGKACFAGKSDKTGAFRVRVNSRLPDGQYGFFVHARTTHGSTIVPLPKAPSELFPFGTMALPRLSQGGPMLAVEPAAAVVLKHGPITLDVPGDTMWDLSFEDYTDEAEGHRLRYAKVPPQAAPPAFAPGAALTYVLAPFEAIASKKVAVRIDESANLPPGSAVEFVTMHGVRVDFSVGAGLGQVAARGHVSADGKSIATDPGEGITTLTWLAVRAAP